MVEANNAEKVIKAIEQLWEDFKKCRSYFPYIKEDAEGRKCVISAFKATIIQSEQLTMSIIEKLNSIAHWQNQNFIIRLNAILDSHRCIPKKDDKDSIKNYQKWKYVDLLRRLRNKFAHGSGKYSADNSEHRRIMQKILDLFSSNLGKKRVEDYVNSEEYPIPIYPVLDGFRDACIEYVKDFFQKAKSVEMKSKNVYRVLILISIAVIIAGVAVYIFVK